MICKIAEQTGAPSVIVPESIYDKVRADCAISLRARLDKVRKTIIINGLLNARSSASPRTRSQSWPVWT